MGSCHQSREILEFDRQMVEKRCDMQRSLRTRNEMTILLLCRLAQKRYESSRLRESIAGNVHTSTRTNAAFSKPKDANLIIYRL